MPFPQFPTALAAAVLAVSFLPAPAAAQAQGAGEIETLVVTARKREEALQEVPVAVSAFGTADIEERQIRTVDDVARFTPGLSFAKGFGRTNERPVIRGLGNVLAGVQFGVESGAAYFVDGVYYPGDLQSLDASSLERIEVIRGPQSALYGRNTYSGAINFVSKSPPREFTTEAAVRYGQDNDLDTHLTVGGPLADGLSASVTARYYSFDGEYTNVVTDRTIGDEETSSLAALLVWDASADFTLRSRLNVQRDRDGTRAFFLQPSEMNNCYPGTRSNAAWPITGSTNDNQYFCGEIRRPNDWVALNDRPSKSPDPVLVPGIPDAPFPGGDPYNPAQGVAFSGLDRDLYYANAIGDWDVGGGGWTLTSALAWRKEDKRVGTDADHSSINMLAGGPGTECLLCGSERDDARDYSAELRLASPVDRRLRWMAGAYYYDQKNEGSDLTFANPHGGDVNETEWTDNKALFGMVEMDLAETITATLEGRWFDEEKRLLQDETVSPVSIPVFDEKIELKRFAPRLTVDWHVTGDVMAYAIYARGYKPGGLNGKPGMVAANPAPTYGPEASDNYELGLKSSLLDDRLTANLALYFIQAREIQLTTPLTTARGQLTSIVTNQGSGEVRGTELELRYALTDDWSAGASYALADTKFTEGCDEFQWTLTSGGGLLTDFAHCTGNDVNGHGDGSIEGNHFPLASKNQVAAFTDFRAPLASELDFVAGADVSWEDRKPVQVHNLAWVPAATLVNARIGLEGDRWSASFYGRNLTGEEAPAMVTRWLQEPLVFGTAGTPSTTAAGAPVGACPPGTCATTYPRAFFGDMRRGRNVGVELAYRFGGK